MEIRKATIEDLEKIAIIEKEVQDLHIENRKEIFKENSINDIKSILKESILDKEIFIASFDNAEIVGLLQISIKIIKNHKNLKDSKVLWINNIGVKKEFQNQGIGKALINKAKQLAKEEQCDRIELNCWKFNQNALDFYKAQGFKKQRIIMEIK